MLMRLKTPLVVLIGALCFTPIAQAQISTLGALASKLFVALIASANEQAIQDELRKQVLSAAERRRGIPVGAVRATMSAPHGRYVRMNGLSLRLAPGAKIRDSKNRIIQPGRIQRDIEVRFVPDNNQNVRTVWLLSEEYYTSTAEQTASTSFAATSLRATGQERESSR